MNTPLLVASTFFVISVAMQPVLSLFCRQRRRTIQENADAEIRATSKRIEKASLQATKQLTTLDEDVEIDSVIGSLYAPIPAVMMAIDHDFPQDDEWRRALECQTRRAMETLQVRVQAARLIAAVVTLVSLLSAVVLIAPQITG